MAFVWTRHGPTITSRCTLCGLTLTDRHEPSLLRVQRAHDPHTCQQHRLAPTTLDAAEDVEQVRARWRAEYHARKVAG